MGAVGADAHFEDVICPSAWYGGFGDNQHQRRVKAGEEGHRIRLVFFFIF